MNHFSDKIISEESQLLNLLGQMKYVSLSLNDGHEPYILTLSAGLNKSSKTLYFHCSKEGTKIDFLQSNAYVCGQGIKDLGYQTGRCTHHYQSVNFWGVLEVIHKEDEKEIALDALFSQLEGKAPQHLMGAKTDNIYLLKLEIEKLTGRSNPGLSQL